MNIISLPFDVLQGMPPGAAVYTNYINENDDVKPMLCIKDYKRYIQRLPYSVFTELRMGVFEVDNVILIALLIQLEHNNDYMYETWINVGTQEAKRFLITMSNSSEIMLSFYDENTTSIRNKKTGVGDLDILKIISVVESKGLWSMDAFDNAREELYKRYPSVLDLWNAIE